MPTSLSSFPIKLGGKRLSVVSNPDAQSGEDVGEAVSGTFVAQASDQQIAKRDVPAYIRRFSKGSGFVEMRDEGDDGGYAWAENAITYLGNGIIPSGQRTAVTGNLGLGGATVLSALGSVLFTGDLWVPLAPQSHKMIRYAGANPVNVPVYDPPLNTFGSATSSFRANYSASAIAVFSNAAGTACIYVAATDGTDTRMYQWNGAAWSESAVLGFHINNMAVCFWEGRDGVGAERLHIDTGSSVIRHCIQGSDPMLAASYVTPITVGNAGYGITRLVAFPQHLYVVKTNGIHDVNELRTWNVTPYWEQTASFNQGTIALAYDDHILATRAFGLDRYDLRLNGSQQRIPGECGPMAFMQDGTPIRGYITAMCEHEGWLLVAIFNPDNKTTYIMRGKDRRILGIDIPNPIVWHGAEQVLPPVSGASVRVYHMRVGPPPASATLLNGVSYLWMFTVTNWETTGTDGILYYAPLPSGSGPLSLGASGGTFTYNASASIFHTALTWGDRNATKSIRRFDLVGRKLSSTRTIQIKMRADADPLTIADASTYTTQGTTSTTATSVSFTPTTNLSGHSLALLSILTTPTPFTAAPILHEISPRARVIRETFEVQQLWVVMERNYRLRGGQPDIRSPDTTFTTVANFQNSTTPLTYIDGRGRTYTGYVEQGLTYRSVEVDGDWRTVMHVEFTCVTGPT